MTQQLIVLRALVAACTLRQVLDEDKAISSLRLNQAVAQLVLECENLIEDRECLIPLALMRERVDAFLRGGMPAESAQAMLRFARHALSRLTTRLWTLLDIERRAQCVDQAAACATGALPAPVAELPRRAG